MSQPQRHTFRLMPMSFAFYRFTQPGDVPVDLVTAPNVYLCTFEDDVSLMAPESAEVPNAAATELNWRCLAITEVLAFSEVGIAAAITTLLAGQGISVLVMSGFSRDYFFIKQDVLGKTIEVLEEAGYAVFAAD